MNNSNLSNFPVLHSWRCASMPVIFAVIASLFCSLAYGATAVTHAELAELSAEAGQRLLIIELSSKAKYKVFSLSNPDRLVIDMAGVDIRSVKKTFSRKNLISGVNGFRFGIPFHGTTRIVLDLAKNISQLEASDQRATHGKEKIIVRWGMPTSIIANKSDTEVSAMAEEHAPTLPEVNQPSHNTQENIAQNEVKGSNNGNTPNDGKLEHPYSLSIVDGKVAHDSLPQPIPEPVPQPATESIEKHTPDSHATATNDKTGQTGDMSAGVHDACGNSGLLCKGHWYALVGVGHPTGNSDIKMLDNRVGALGGSGFSSSLSIPTGYKLQAGYLINKNFAVEGGYIGSRNKIYTVSGGTPGTGSDNITGWDLTAVGILPLYSQYSLSLLGKLGIADIKDSASLNYNGLATSSGTMTNLTYGIGAQFDFTQSAFGRISVDSYKIGNSLISNRYTGWTIDAGYKF